MWNVYFERDLDMLQHNQHLISISETTFKFKRLLKKNTMSKHKIKNALVTNISY